MAWSKAAAKGMFIGREHERDMLREAIRSRQSLLVFGPAGSGKSALLNAALTSLDDATRARCIVCAADGAPAEVWAGVARALAEAGDSEVLVRAEHERVAAQGFENWLCRQTSLRLRGILRHAARAREYSIIFESSGRLHDGVYRLLQEWVWSGRTPVVLLARGTSEREIGKVARLFWHDGLRLQLGPLEPSAAGELLEAGMRRFGLEEIADESFREFVLLQSERLPGRMLRLCEMAATEKYRWQGRIKLHTLVVDFLLERNMPKRALSRAPSHD